MNKTSLKVLKSRYLRKFDDGSMETPEELFMRVATNVARMEDDFDKWRGIFFDMMNSLKFLPNSPCLMNAGTPLQMLFGCFVIPIDDSIEGIFEAVKQAAIVHKSGGGTGFSFSRLRPKDDTVMSTKGRASGPLSFMTVFNAATDVIKQGGKRRGANLACLRVDHPDIEDFIEAKKDNSKYTNFNISVGVTNDFMQACLDNKKFALVNPSTGETTKHIDAKNDKS